MSSNDKNEDGLNTRLILAIMTAALFVSVFTNTMVNVAIPLIRNEFGISEGVAGWVITGYAVPFAIYVPIYGRVSDLFSLKRVFALGLATLAVGLVICALAPNFSVLIAGRALQGIGAGAIPALSFGAIAKLLPKGERGIAYGALSSSVGVGSAAGPVLGGVISGLAGWQWLFVTTLILTLIILASALYVLPHRISEGPGEGASLRKLDLPGGLLLAAAAGLTLFSVTQAETINLASPAVWGSLVLALAAAGAFAWHIRTAREPFVDPRLFANPTFVAAIFVGFLAQFANIGSLFLTPLLLEDTNGLAPAQAGLTLAPGAVAIALLSPLAGRLSDRYGPWTVLPFGLMMMLAAAFVLSSFVAGATAYLIAGGLLLLGVGYSGVNSPAANAASEAVSRQAAGTGLGIYQLFFFMGSGSGPAVLGAVLAARSGGARDAVNPLYTLQATPFSDAFLVAGAAVILALLIAIWRGRQTDKPSRT